jgi:lysozyme family protein
MADFMQAYEAMIQAEGGYKLHTVEGDTGGMTYAGIARNKNPDWPGWAWIDRDEIPPTQLVRDYYRAGWWAPICGDELSSQAVATSFFNFAVNSSERLRPKKAIKVAQLAARVTPDGDLGPKTLAAIEAMGEDLFLARFTLAQIARHTEICNRDRSRVQAKQFLLGWNNRDLAGYQL